LQHLRADKISSAFGTPGIDLHVASGAPGIGATLDTPNGSLTIYNHGMDRSGLRGLAHIARLRLLGR